MARVSGPALSVRASGTLGGSIQYRAAGARAIVCLPRRLRGYDGPASTARRAIFSGLAALWRSMAQASQDDWANAMTGNDSSPWSAFIRTNLTRWGNYLQPALARPDVDAATPGFPGLSSGIKRGNTYSIIYGLAIPTSSQFAICHHSLTNGFTPNRTTAIHMRTLIPYNLHRELLGTFANGTHYFRISTANLHGNELRLGTQLGVTFP